MTDASRMSALSDFPAPPDATPAHMAVLSSYFGTPILERGNPMGTPPLASLGAVGRIATPDTRALGTPPVIVGPVQRTNSSEPHAEKGLPPSIARGRGRSNTFGEMDRP
jgi:hypothetical protein